MEFANAGEVFTTAYRTADRAVPDVVLVFVHRVSSHDCGAVQGLDLDILGAFGMGAPSDIVTPGISSWLPWTNSTRPSLECLLQDTDVAPTHASSTASALADAF